MNNFLATALEWMAGFALFVPFQILKLIGQFLPTCTELNITGTYNYIVDAGSNALMFSWPVVRFLPWEHFWGLISAWVLMFIVLFAIEHFDDAQQISWKVWLVVAFLYVISGFISIFTGDDWRTNAFIVAVLGEPCPSGLEGEVGGECAGGGGGGGSW